MRNSVITGLSNGKADPPGHLHHLVLLCMIEKTFCVMSWWFSHPVQHSSLQVLCMITCASFLRHVQNCNSSINNNNNNSNNNGEAHSLRLFF